MARLLLLTSNLQLPPTVYIGILVCSTSRYDFDLPSVLDPPPPPPLPMFLVFLYVLRPPLAIFVSLQFTPPPPSCPPPPPVCSWYSRTFDLPLRIFSFRTSPYESSVLEHPPPPPPAPYVLGIPVCSWIFPYDFDLPSVFEPPPPPHMFLVFPCVLGPPLPLRRLDLRFSLLVFDILPPFWVGPQAPSVLKQPYNVYSTPPNAPKHFSC